MRCAKRECRPDECAPARACRRCVPGPACPRSSGVPSNPSLRSRSRSHLEPARPVVRCTHPGALDPGARDAPSVACIGVVRVPRVRVRKCRRLVRGLRRVALDQGAGEVPELAQFCANRLVRRRKGVAGRRRVDRPRTPVRRRAGHALRAACATHATAAHECVPRENTLFHAFFRMHRAGCACNDARCLVIRSSRHAGMPGRPAGCRREKPARRC